jgi:hypothetical protein
VDLSRPIQSHDRSWVYWTEVGATKTHRPLAYTAKGHTWQGEEPQMIRTVDLRLSEEG